MGQRRKFSAEFKREALAMRKLPRQGHSGKGEFLVSEVDPVSRRFLTRADSFFGHFDYLTLCDKLVRCQVPE